MSQLSISCMCLWLCLCHCVCLFGGQDMSLHHSDQMSGRYEDYYIVFCMSISKVLSEWVSEWVSQWQGHLLSRSGQLNTDSSSPPCPARAWPFGIGFTWRMLISLFQHSRWWAIASSPPWVLPGDCCSLARHIVIRFLGTVIQLIGPSYYCYHYYLYCIIIIWF